MLSNSSRTKTDFLNISIKAFIFHKNQYNRLKKVSLYKRKDVIKKIRSNYGREGEGYGKINIGGGDSIRLPKKKKGFVPRYELTHTDAVKLQMKALEDNNKPYDDHGVEVLYRFADLDIFGRSNYFGIALDLGQFERFRRMLHSPKYSLLICHTNWQILSILQISDQIWKHRIWVMNKYRMEESGVFEFNMIQKLGGHYDSYFFTKSLLRDDHI